MFACTILHRILQVRKNTTFIPTTVFICIVCTLTFMYTILREHDVTGKSTQEVYKVTYNPAYTAYSSGAGPSRGRVWQPVVDQYHLRVLQCTQINVTTLEELQRVRKRTRGVFSPPKIQFLPNFKNPCWLEPQESADLHLEQNGFLVEILSNPQSYGWKVVQSVQDDWQEKFESGARKRIRCLPYFYLAGMTKSATSELWIDLLSHPNISPGLLFKETQWWNRRALGVWTRNKTHFSQEDYIGLYDKVAETIESNNTLGNFHPIITGDGSPSTLWSSDLWPLYPGNNDVKEPRTLTFTLIHRFTPQAKTILILRNPVDRLYSHYFHNMERYKLKGTKRDFHQKAIAQVNRLEECWQQRSLRECIYDSCINGDVNFRQLPLRAGLYHVYIEDWLRVFPRDQLKVVRFEDYTSDKLPTLNELWEFLDVGPVPTNISEQIKSRNNTRRTRVYREHRELAGDMWSTTRTFLVKFYKPFNLKLAKFLGDERYLWNS